MNNDINKVIKGDVDLYDFLGVNTTASLQEIRTQYRRKALVYHPDKNPGSEDKFDLLGKAYGILSDEHLRSSYDEIRRVKQMKDARNGVLDALTKKFRDELESAEKEYKYKNNIDVDDPKLVKRRQQQYTVERLKEEGLKKRRLLEKSVLNLQTKSKNDACVYFDQLPTPKQVVSFKVANSNEVVVKWKHKRELEGLFDEKVLSEIMSIFGPVRSSNISKSRDSRYDTGNVEFEHVADAEVAVRHDYSRSASLWDGTGVRKLASLLRGCDYFDADKKFGERELEKLINTAVYNQ